MLGLPRKKLKLAWLVSFFMFTGPRGCESQQSASSLLTEGHKPEAIPGPSSSLTLGTSFTALWEGHIRGLFVVEPCAAVATSRGSVLSTVAEKIVALVGARSSDWCLFVCLTFYLFFVAYTSCNSVPLISLSLGICPLPL